MASIVFVWPPVSAEERYGVLAAGGSYMPPIGIATLAAIVRNKGHEPEIIDCEALQLTPSKSARMILDANPDYVAFFSTTLSMFAAAKVASLIKDERPELPIFAGGPHVTAVPEKTLELFQGFDFLAIGEGHNTIVDVLDALERMEPVWKKFRDWLSVKMDLLRGQDRRLRQEILICCHFRLSIYLIISRMFIMPLYHGNICTNNSLRVL